MKKSEIQQNLHTLSQNIEQENFIYEFLSSFGLSKTTITRLKKGDYNLSKVDGELFYKGKIFFKVEKEANLLNLIDELAKDEKIKKQKPRFIVVTDFKDVLAVDTKLGNNKEFPIEELSEQTDFFLPLSGAEIYRVSNDNKLDRDAAYKLGELYDILVVDNPDWIAQGSHQLNIFLSRLLFCFFAEDTGIFDVKSIFTETLANNTKKDGSDVDLFLTTLFKKLNTPDNQGSFEPHFDKFPYVNGGLFRDDIQCPKFSTKARQILLDSGELDWSEINPDIFGSMIQAVADPAERNNLGMHYTSVVNILKLIKPLFLDDLYEEFEKNKGKIKGLEALLDRLGKIKFFDPACGSGNFLIITYKELRNLEIQIIKELLDLNVKQRKIYFSEIKLSQFYGIEIKDFAHEMAILSLWLAEHQMNQVFELELLDYGKSNPILPLKESGNITAGNAARVDWEQVCPKNDASTGSADEIYIIGNPPYLGSRKQKSEQKSDLEFNFKHLKKYKDLDYISIWFYKGAKYIKDSNHKLAFVSTNSICQGEQVPLLWPHLFDLGLKIDFAYQSFKWINNAKGNAGVTVIIIGLINQNNKTSRLISVDNLVVEVDNINAYLIPSKRNIFIEQKTTSISNLPKINHGNMPADGGVFLFTTQEKNDFIMDEPESEVWFKKILSVQDHLNGKERWCLWLENIDEIQLSKLPKIKEKIEEVRQIRLKSSRPKLAEVPHLFAQITQPIKGSCVIIPRVSSENREYLPIEFIDSSIFKVTDSYFTVSTDEPYLFGIISSKMHLVWIKSIGGRLETRLQYSKTLCYNTFPFPSLSEKKKETINQYVFAILDERAKYPEKTMAWLYNPETMPSGLKQAHKELDLAIEQIYRLAPFHSDEERLEYLFKLYDEMTTKETLFAKEKKGKKK